MTSLVQPYKEPKARSFTQESYDYFCYCCASKRNRSQGTQDKRKKLKQKADEFEELKRDDYFDECTEHNRNMRSPRGIYNFGYTSFMNSAFQALGSIPNFASTLRAACNSMELDRDALVVHFN